MRRFLLAIALVACSRTTTTTHSGSSGTSGTGGSSGAGGAGGAKVCEPETERECNCPDGSLSTLFCLHDGSDWSDCDCFAAGASGSSGSSGSAGASGAAGAGGSGATGGGGVGGTGGASGTSGTAGAGASGATCGDGPQQPIAVSIQWFQVNGPDDPTAGGAASLCDASCGFPPWAFTVYPDGTAPPGCVVRDIGSNVACCEQPACSRYPSQCTMPSTQQVESTFESCSVGAVASAGCEVIAQQTIYCCQ